MAFAIRGIINEQDSLGQSWAGDIFDENLKLCEYQTIRHVFTEYLPRDGKIIEAGCGLGRWVFYLRKQGYNIEGIEISDQALAQIKQYDENHWIKKGDILHLPYNDSSIDAVISLGVVEHFEEGPQEALMDARRVLKPDGLLLISIPPENFLRRFFLHPQLAFKQYINSFRGKKYSFLEYRFRQKEFIKHLKNSGFQILNTFNDELDPPKNIGLYADYPKLRSKNGNWELNRAGLFFEWILRKFSVSLYQGGILFLCKNKK